MKGNLILSLNNAKDFLKNKNEEGNCVYDHICELINFIIVEKPEKCYENFEIISNHIKENKKNNNKIVQNVLSEKEKKQNTIEAFILNEYLQRKKEWHEKIKSMLIGNPKIQPNKFPFMNNLFDQVKLIHWAGYSINQHIVCYLNYSMKKILDEYKNKIKSLNFWGIIKGLRNDYYIMEGIVKNNTTIFEKEIENDNSENDEEEETKDSEDSNKSSETSSSQEHSKKKKKKKKKDREKERKAQMKNKSIFNYQKEDYEEFNKKVNQHIYWVSINGNSEWELLNFIDPASIKISQQANKMLTGNLNHLIKSFPNLIISEKKYLRAIISIISSSTHIAPKNYYTLSPKMNKKNKGDENGDTDNDEEEEEDEEEDNEKEDDEEEDNEKEDEEEGSEDKEKKGNLVKNKKFKFDIPKLVKLNNWVYYKHGFLKNGHINYPKKVRNRKNKKIQNFIKKNPPLHILRSVVPSSYGKQKEIEQEEEEEEEEEESKVEKQIKENQNDQWRIKHLNTGQYYGKQESHYDIIIIYNLSYYGAFTIYSNKQYFNFYIGSGIQINNKSIHMLYTPQKIQSDQSEISDVNQTNA